MTLASSVNKPSNTFDELMSTPIDFFAFIMNGLKINNLTQETLLGPAFRLLKGTRIEDMVPNIWVLVKVAYDKHALWGISHWREQRKSFYGYARGLQSRHDVYSIKRILAVTQVEVMRKHGYGYLKEIVVRRADNDLYRFKEGDFPRLRINDIEDMLLLVVQNRLTNLSGDDVFDFAIALRMFTRSLVIQKRVEDLQLGVESYQKKINVTKPQTTISGIRKRDPYTPYQDPQGFIYVDTLGRNRLMRSDELYKFSDRTLTGLRTSLDDITKNIQMEYLPKRRWSTLEKKRANIMIKAIDKQLKERSQNQRDLPRDIPLDSVVVLRYEKRSKSKNKGRVPAEMELNWNKPNKYDESNTYVLVRFNTTAGNPVKKILLKLNLPDHRLTLTDSKEYIKMDMEDPGSNRLSRFIATCSYSTDIYEDIMIAQVEKPICMRTSNFPNVRGFSALEGNTHELGYLDKTTGTKIRLYTTNQNGIGHTSVEMESPSIKATTSESSS
ncbi:hypothetical protein Tco_1301965 [Tanacetum coccineum]